MTDISTSVTKKTEEKLTEREQQVLKAWEAILADNNSKIKAAEKYFRTQIASTLHPDKHLGEKQKYTEIFQKLNAQLEAFRRGDVRSARAVKLAQDNEAREKISDEAEKAKQAKVLAQNEAEIAAKRDKQAKEQKEQEGQAERAKQAKAQAAKTAEMTKQAKFAAEFDAIVKARIEQIEKGNLLLREGINRFCKALESLFKETILELCGAKAREDLPEKYRHMYDRCKLSFDLNGFPGNSGNPWMFGRTIKFGRGFLAEEFIHFLRNAYHNKYLLQFDDLHSYQLGEDRDFSRFYYLVPYSPAAAKSMLDGLRKICTQALDTAAILQTQLKTLLSRIENRDIIDVASGVDLDNFVIKIYFRVNPAIEYEVCNALSKRWHHAPSIKTSFSFSDRIDGPIGHVIMEFARLNQDELSGFATCINNEIIPQIKQAAKYEAITKHRRFLYEMYDSIRKHHWDVSYFGGRELPDDKNIKVPTHILEIYNKLQKFLQEQEKHIYNMFSGDYRCPAFRDNFNPDEVLQTFEREIKEVADTLRPTSRSSEDTKKFDEEMAKKLRGLLPSEESMKKEMKS